VRIGVSGLAVGHPTGLGRLSRTCLQALAQAAPDWELHVYFRDRGHCQALADECRHNHRDEPRNIVPHFPPVRGLNRLLLEELDLPRQFAGLKLDTYLGCDFTLPPRALAPREVVILPDMLPFTQPFTVGWRARFLYRRGLGRSVRRQATVLCISQYTKAQFQQCFPAFSGEARVVYPALSPRLMHLAQRSRSSDLRLQVQGSLHAVTAPGPFLLSVGVLGARKNTALLASTYRRLVLSGKYPGSLILAGGDGRYHTAPREQRLALEAARPLPRQRGETTPHIYDLGYVSDGDLSQLYRDADLLVSLSTEEGFGYPVLEALAHGTPALVTAGSSMTEIAQEGIAATGLKPDECSGRLVSALRALPLLRQEAARLDLGRYSIARLGADLKAVLLGDNLPQADGTGEAPQSPVDAREP